MYINDTDAAVGDCGIAAARDFVAAAAAAAAATAATASGGGAAGVAGPGFFVAPAGAAPAGAAHGAHATPAGGGFLAAALRGGLACADGCICAQPVPATVISPVLYHFRSLFLCLFVASLLSLSLSVFVRFTLCMCVYVRVRVCLRRTQC